ncbi:hypothetical protein A2994_01550 [candidate division Kazan bacterium RIFCSPLOWO2_01_FULL_48_13]|uniref:mRNA interferase n=1 Tax=candidate division Kazan bacterium RIFCSPLOWO2_01_FULL_48_13 TaxID=1798539 RepID=A0A1F4PMT4_UNCK3|nr:MAG: hypothetical protein A2994_01550 [candidate division Kazan bacterium RIFCSPLOWO2_01_FULL_48_13]
MKIERGEIYVVNLIEKDAKGFEIGKKRPAIIVQANPWNEELPTTIVVPLSTTPPKYMDPGTVTFQEREAGLEENSTVVFPEIRGVDKSRLGKRIGKVNSEKMRKVDNVLSLILGLNPID